MHEYTNLQFLIQTFATNIQHQLQKMCVLLILNSTLLGKILNAIIDIYGIKMHEKGLYFLFRKIIYNDPRAYHHSHILCNNIQIIFLYPVSLSLLLITQLCSKVLNAKSVFKGVSDLLL